MTPTSHVDHRENPVVHLLFAILIAVSSALIIVAATIDPWLLVVLAGVGLTVFAIYDRTDPDWYTI